MTEIVPLDTESEEYKRMTNDYNDYINTFVSGFVTNLFSQGIIEEVDAEKLKNYFSNPDTFQKEIDNLAQYYYISSGEIHQLFELIEALPSLNYKLDSFDKNKNTDKYIGMINKTLHKVKHKRLTRDLLKQTSASGTLVGMWLGDKNNIYSYVFDDVKLVFPAYRKNGEWQCVIDMEYFSTLNDSYRNEQFANLSPHLTKQDYDNYKKDNSKKYKELPQDRTFVLRTGTLKRNQGLGTSLVTSGLYDVLHKKKLKDVEYSIANKIINAVAVLTVGVNGDEKYDSMTNLKLPKPVKQKVHSGVKQALEKSNSKGVTVVTIPDFAKLDFPDISTDGLGDKKYESVNSDIKTAYGMSGALLNGDGGNYSAAKLNLDTFYKKLGVLLEDIEQECYQKLINLILPSSQNDNFKMEYDKSTPLTHKEKVDILMKLNDKGWTVKAVVDNLPDISWESFLEQTIYETEVLKLQERIKPYLQSSVLSGGNNGRPSSEDSNNENTIKSKTGNNNDLPE